MLVCAPSSNWRDLLSFFDGDDFCLSLLEVDKFLDFFGFEAKSKTENETIISVFFENVREEDALLVLQKSQEVRVFKLHKASIMSGQSEKSYNLEIVYVAG